MVLTAQLHLQKQAQIQQQLQQNIKLSNNSTTQQQVSSIDRWPIFESLQKRRICSVVNSNSQVAATVPQTTARLC